MATIEIDGKSYEVQTGRMLIEVTDELGINIPRFCYHKKLSVAANCRMCLVEVEKAPKPLPACATPIMDGMKVFTRSPKALMAQQAVMEFLLINHPLDCPICDQGGECELQDVAMGHGQGLSRYTEGNRVVADKNIGPLIATEMTRCIHCTRCVRFGEEIAGIKELGATGRGEHTRIGTYIEQSVNSELSGNVIDLCPVGALTSKPFRFTARAWEIRRHPGIAPHDALGSNLAFHVFRDRVARVVPRENEAINELWLSDRDRFSHVGLYAADRLTRPMIKREGEWLETDWETALAQAAESLKGTLGRHGPEALAALASPGASLEELYLMQKLFRGLGSRNLDHRLGQVDFRDQAQAPLFPWLGQSLGEFEQNDAFLIIGSHLRKEVPLLNHRLRRAALRREKPAKVMFINPLDYEYNLPVWHNSVVPPSAWIRQLAGIAKALLEDKRVKSSPGGSLELLKSVQADEHQGAIAAELLDAEKPVLLLGQMATAHPEFSVIRALAGMIADMSGAGLAYTGAANSVGAALAGMLPHRKAGGEPENQPGRHVGDMLAAEIKGYVLLGLEPELDAWDGEAARRALKRAECVVALSAFRSPGLEECAQVLLPLALFPETGGSYLNLENRWQVVNGAVPPPGDARPGWKILRVLGNLLNRPGFDYTSVEAVRRELEELLQDSPAPSTLNAWQMPETLPETSAASSGELERIGEMPLYSVDPLCRRAAPLQQTGDARAAAGLHLHPETAAELGLGESARARVKQVDGGEAILDWVADARVPKHCALIYAGRPENVALGGWWGRITVTTE